jgi:hypothetical protein
MNVMIDELMKIAENNDDATTRVSRAAPVRDKGADEIRIGGSFFECLVASAINLRFRNC